MIGLSIARAYGRRIHAREVVALDEAGESLCWVRIARFGEDWLLIRANPSEVANLVRQVRQIPEGASSIRFPALNAGAGRS